MRTSDKSIQCATINCFNVKRKHKRFCNTCRARKYRERNPASRLLSNLRSSAKRRGITCDITLSEWKTWCDVTGFLAMPRGRKKGSRSIGRIDHSKGYSITNIQAEEYMFNAHKRQSDVQDDNCPF